LKRNKALFIILSIGLSLGGCAGPTDDTVASEDQGASTPESNDSLVNETETEKTNIIDDAVSPAEDEQETWTSIDTGADTDIIDGGVNDGGAPGDATVADGSTPNEDSEAISDALEGVEADVQDADVQSDEDADGDSTEECVSDPDCTIPGLYGCGTEQGSIVICKQIEVGCLKWQPWDTCPDSQICEEGQCTSSCLPNCPLNWCGEDGCGGSCSCLGGDKVCIENICESDGDGDGVPKTLDCDDTDPLVYPGAEELFYDGKNNDCDDSTLDGDADGDGAICTCMGGDDCDDDNSAIYPLFPDMIGDGEDLNCDGHDGVDSDGDSYASIESGGTDCDDNIATTNPGTGDPWGDGVDSNCDGVDGFAPPPLPDGKICLLSGEAGDTFSCPIQVATYSQKGPKPVGLSGVFNYHASKATFLGPVTAPCEGEACDTLDLNNGFALSTGHQWSSLPAGTAEEPFAGKVAWVLLNPSSYETALSDAIQDPNQTVSGQADVLWLRFKLKTDVAFNEPVSVVMTTLDGLSENLEKKTATIDDGLIVVYP